MPTPFLALNTFNGTTPQLRRYNGGSVNLVGVSFGSLDTGMTTARDGAINRAIQFGSEDTFLACTGNQIYRSTDGGASWTSVKTLTSLATNQTRKTGLNIVTVNGVPTLTVFWQDTGGPFRGTYSTDGVTWTEESLGTPSGIGSSLSINYVFRNTLYAIAVDASSIFGYQPGTSTITRIAIPDNGDRPKTICEFNDQLACMYCPSATDGLAVGTSDGVTDIVHRVTLAGGSGTPTSSARLVLFEDSGSLIAMGHNGSAAGWRAWSISSAFVATEITTPVIPPGMTGTTGGGNSTLVSRGFVLIDSEASPGSNPAKYVLYTPIDGSQYVFFQYNGTAAVMTSVDNGGSNQQALSLTTNIGGNYFWTDGERTLEFIGRTPVTNGQRLQFQLFSETGTDVVSVRFYRGTADTEYPTALATLSNPSHGAISGGNTNTGLTANNGATTYEVTWEAVTDGFSPGTRYKLTGEQFV
jgi:hypothetical protein